MVSQTLTSKLKNFFQVAGKKKAVLGLSGGVDSALVLKLCADALGGANVYAYYLPYFESPEDVSQVKAWAKVSGCRFETYSIKRPVDELCDTVGNWDTTSKGNFMARTRMSLLYHQARQHQALVVGTGNKSELKTGYFTKYGDGGVDVLPLGNLYKTDVWNMSRLLGIPRHFIEKTPSAGLWEGQTDEKEMGISYVELDEILRVLEKRPDQAVRHFGQEKVSLVLDRMKLGEHKLKLPPIL